MHCFVGSTWGDWDVFLPADKFTLNLTYSASTRYSPAFILYGHEPVLSFEHAICSLVDVTFFFIADYIKSISEVIA